MSTPAVALFTDDPGWHGARLAEAFAERGLEARPVSLTAGSLFMDGADGEVVLPGFATPPVAAFVRGVPDGTLEEVVTALNLLHALKALGVPVYNDGRAIERSVDKAYTTLRLRAAGIPTPATWVTTDRSQAMHRLAAEHGAGRTVVMKPLFGSQGRDVIRLDPGTPLPPAEPYQGVYYLQRLTGNNSGDYRVLVIGGRAIAAMRRDGGDWIHNVARGARCMPAAATGDLAALAVRATAALEMDYAGVDLVRDDDGQFRVLEVNSVPAWKGLQAVAPMDIATALVEDLWHRHLKRRLGVAL